MDSHNIGRLVTLACVREVMCEKPGCVSFSYSEPEKDAYDFVAAAVNSAFSFVEFAKHVRMNARTPTFMGFPYALRLANRGKSAKTVNFGILEIMYPAVHASLLTSEANSVPDKMVALLSREQNSDVRSLLEARAIAFVTSRKADKKSLDTNRYVQLPSVRAFYDALVRDFPPESAHHQWGLQFQQGFPVLHSYLAALAHQPWKEATESTYAALRRAHPEMKLGILADMAAAALFVDLHFSRK